MLFERERDVAAIVQLAGNRGERAQTESAQGFAQIRRPDHQSAYAPGDRSSSANDQSRLLRILVDDHDVGAVARPDVRLVHPLRR